MSFSLKKQSKLVSILICSRNRRQVLENLISALKKMSTNYCFEIVVVEETNNPIPIDGVKYVDLPIMNYGIAYARNIALENATGNIIVFIDDDCEIRENWLNNLLKPFEDKAVIAVQGGVTVPDDSNILGRVESLLGFPGGGVRRVIKANSINSETKEISTLNCAYRGWAIKAIGGFDESLKFGSEDYLLAKQICNFGKCLFVPSAIVHHEPRGHLIKIWYWFVRRGAAEIDLIKTSKQMELTSFGIIRASLIIKVLALFTISIILPQFSFYLIFMTALLYYSILFAQYYKYWKSSQTSIKVLLLIPVVKLAMDLAMDFGRLRGIFFD